MSEAKQFRKEINKPVTRKFPTRSVKSGGFLNILTSDLEEMKPVIQGYKYILVVMDMYSRKAWAFPLKNKQTKTVVEKFRQLFDELPKTPNFLWSDRGTEFTGKPMQDFLKKHNVKQYSTYSVNKASVIERFNRTLKLMMENDDQNWLDALPRLIHEYNNTVHSGINEKPNNVFERKAIPTGSPLIYSKRFKDKPKFKVGDHVRVSIVKAPFEKQTNNWSKRIYTVSKVLDTNPITYKIDDIVEGTVQGSFYPQELQKTDMNFFPIAEIKKTRTRNGQKEILAKFEGYEDLKPEWIQAEDIKDFEKK